MDGRIVELVIENCPPVILDGVLDSRDSDNKD